MHDERKRGGLKGKRGLRSHPYLGLQSCLEKLRGGGRKERLEVELGRDTPNRDRVALEEDLV